MQKKWVVLLSVWCISCASAFAGDAPSIGGDASITATIGQGGIINAGAGASGFQGTVKQSIASVLSGSVGGGVKLNVTIGEAGILNVGAGASGAKITACQSIGTIGSDCND